METNQELATLRQQLAEAKERADMAEKELESPDYFDFLAPTREFHAWLEKYGLEACNREHLAELRAKLAASEQDRAELRAEVERMKASVGCARQQGSTQFCTEAVTAIQQRDAFKAAAARLAGALKPFLENTGVCAPIASDHPLTGPWVKYRDGLVGRWAEDGSPYYIRLPAQLADSLIEAQRLATLAYLGRDALSAYAKAKEGYK